MNEEQIVNKYLLTACDLQLAAAKAATGKETAVLTLADLYANIKKYTRIPGYDLSDFLFSNFLLFVDAHRDWFVLAEGELGVKVNLIGLKDGY